MTNWIANILYSSRIVLWSFLVTDTPNTKFPGRSSQILLHYHENQNQSYDQTCVYAADWNLTHCRPSLFPPNLDRFVFSDHLLDLKPGTLCNQSALFFPHTFRLIDLTLSWEVILTMARKGPEGEAWISLWFVPCMYDLNTKLNGLTEMDGQTQLQALSRSFQWRFRRMQTH